MNITNTNKVPYIRYKNSKKKSTTKKYHTDSNETYIKMFSSNAAGLVKGKMASLLSEVNATGSNIVTIQETHAIRKGKIVMPADFVVFESIRRRKHGGTMCAVKHYLNPKLIEEYNDPFELLIVEVEVENKGIRIITGCGPQENLEEEKRMQFFIALEAEIVKSELAGKSTIIELDANTKLGPEHIPNDQHRMSGNGIILSNIIERHALIVANGTKECKGLVTRQRSITNRTERSCIDLVLFSTDLGKHFKNSISTIQENMSSHGSPTQRKLSSRRRAITKCF